MPIRKDTVSWGYVTNVLEKRLRVVFAENTTRWHRNGIMKELLVKFRQYERKAREQGKRLWDKSR